MSLRDFERCTPSEFRAIYGTWQQQRDWSERSAWERMRMLSLCSLQPYSKSRLSARDILEFPWEKRPQTKRSAPSQENLQERYKAAKKKYGLK